MDYATDVLRSLLQRLIEKTVVTKHPQLMLRRTESVVEKMLTNYMAICMYDYLKRYAGSSLFLLFKAIKHQIEKGVVDACTHEAKYSLSEDKLLREQIPHRPVVLHIVQDDLDEKLQCKVLDCDTISQVKSKILDALFKNTPFSMRPSVHEVDLEWRQGRGGLLTLQDEDIKSQIIGNQYKQLNTLAHYKITESAIVSLVARPIPETYNTYHHKQSRVNTSKINSQNYYNNNSHSIISEFDNCGMSPGLSIGNYQYFHLVKPIFLKSVHDDHSLNIKNMALSIGVLSGNSNCNPNMVAGAGHPGTGCKAIPEIFLTRLLATKGTVQKFVDDFFATILTVNEELPPAVKWLFDLLDESASRHGITDPEIVHAWKSNR
jgi:plexin A